jgi:hypothetical protein
MTNVKNKYINGAYDDKSVNLQSLSECVQNHMNAHVFWYLGKHAIEKTRQAWVIMHEMKTSENQ